jgi:NAD(P)-dependent dehydrogenase (short-subunit alcohol dehydrogenase family)
MDQHALSGFVDMRGRSAIVTGATRGIGLAIAEGLAAAGASVAVASRKADACAATAERLTEQGATVIGIPTHMGDLDAVSGLVRQTVDAFGGLDIVVNNAATALAAPIADLTPAMWAKSYDVNLRGPVFLVQDALPHLRSSEHAAVLNVISAGAFLFSAGTSMYAGAKAALMAFTRSMAAEFAADGIRVNALAPGTVETDMVHNESPERQERMRRASLMGRGADPAEMVGPALFLLSDAASYITGQVLLADGGLTPH